MTNKTTVSLSEKFIDLDGIRLRYLIGGTGRPLVLCHGFLSSGEEFGGRFAALSQKRLLIAPDLPGNGLSSPLVGRNDADAMAKTIWLLLNRLDVYQFDLAGLCLGSSVACALAKEHSESVGRLILHTPLLGRNLLRVGYHWQIRIFTSLPLWSLIVLLSRQKKLSDFYKRWVVEGKGADPKTSHINYQNQLRADPRAARDWLLDSLYRNDFNILRQLHKPTLIIVPQHDRLVNIQRLFLLAAKLPNVTLIVDESGGHGWTPDAVLRHLSIINDYLSK